MNFKTAAFLLLMPFIFYFNAYATEFSVEKELLNAATRGNNEKVKELLLSGVNPDARDRLGNTPLILASDGGYLETVKLLINKKASVNAMNKYGYTPLLSAVTGKHRYIASLLVKAGADPKIPNLYGTSAEDYIKVQGFFTINEYISGDDGAISTLIDDRKPRRGSLGSLHNTPWREEFNRLLSENKSGDAAEYLVQKAREGNDEAAFLLGALLIERNNTEEGVSWLKKALESQDGEVLYGAAKALADSGVPSELPLANKALERSAEKGNVRAMTEYAKNLLQGYGLVPDKEKAYKFFTQAAEANFPEALFYKNYMDYAGVGQETDEKLALDNIRKAMDMGSMTAKIFIEKIDTESMMKQISRLASSRNAAKTYFASINIPILQSNDACDEYDLSTSFTASYKILKASICNAANNEITFYLSPIADKDEVTYLKNLSQDSKFIIGEMELH